MIDLTAIPVKNHSLEYCTALILSFFLTGYSIWTIGSHVSVLLEVPWIYFSRFSLYVIIFISIISFFMALNFAKNYCNYLHNNVIEIKHLSAAPAIVAMSAALFIFLCNNYTSKFIIVAISLIAITKLSREKKFLQKFRHKTLPNNQKVSLEYFLILVLLASAITIALFSHRPDWDDSSFLQIAAQTLAHKNFAPLSFDASLGYILDTFRFSPYKISSYENLVAFISEKSNLTIYSVYYIFVPTVTAALTILTAFLFSRLFFSTNILAISATATFLIVMFAWGETHYAYGNRVFVRLFQGKGLIIAITTPFSIIAGMMLIKRPSFFNASMLTIANICAIGVSSSGLVITVFTGLIIFILALGEKREIIYRSYFFLAGSMLYPILLACWLKFQSKIAVPLSHVGTDLPINASLGMNFRESAVLSGLLFGYLLFSWKQNKFYILMIVALFAFILNPWFSELLASNTSRNMSWRLAWAAPVPLLFSIALVAGYNLIKNPPTLRPQKITKVIKYVSIGLLIIFVFCYRWSSHPSNNVTWGLPSAKLPIDFYITEKISNRLRALNLQGQILATHRVAAWLPLTLPGVKLVMPGHTYPIQLETVLPKHDYENRMKLYNAINRHNADFTQLTDLLIDLNVELIITPSKNQLKLVDSSSSRDTGAFNIETIETIYGYSLIRIHRVFPEHPTLIRAKDENISHPTSN